MMQNDFGLISIIMAAYNAEKTIEQAIAQSWRPRPTFWFGLLVVNSCSTDRTAGLVKVTRRGWSCQILSLM